VQKIVLDQTVIEFLQNFAPLIKKNSSFVG